MVEINCFQINQLYLGTWWSFSCTTGMLVSRSVHWLSMRDSSARRAAVSTFFSRRSWFPVLMTDDFREDLASTSLENSLKKQKSQCSVLASTLDLSIEGQRPQTNYTRMSRAQVCGALWRQSNAPHLYLQKRLIHYLKPNWKRQPGMPPVCINTSHTKLTSKLSLTTQLLFCVCWLPVYCSLSPGWETKWDHMCEVLRLTRKALRWSRTISSSCGTVTDCWVQKASLSFADCSQCIRSAASLWYLRTHERVY